MGVYTNNIAIYIIIFHFKKNTKKIQKNTKIIIVQKCDRFSLIYKQH